MKCRSCGAGIAAGSTTCRACGVPVAMGRRAGGGLLFAVAVGIVLGLVVVGVYWWLEIRPRLARIENPWVDARPEAATARVGGHDAGALFDLSVDLPGDPLGAVWLGDRFLIGNRQEPWGLLVVEPRGDRRWRATKQPVIETTYGQRMAFASVAWDGREIVAVTEGAWFERPGTVFVTIEPASYHVVGVRAAPDGLGCLAWDGRGFWGATRRHTADEDRPARLYRFDAKKVEVASYDPPGVGCQGLAWDGRRLWFADVFDDSLTLLDLASGEPRWSGGDRFEIEYLSGVAWDGESIWIAEYGDKRLHRLNPILQRAWTGRCAQVEAEP